MVQVTDTETWFPLLNQGSTQGAVNRGHPVYTRWWVLEIEQQGKVLGLMELGVYFRGKPIKLNGPTFNTTSGGGRNDEGNAETS